MKKIWEIFDNIRFNGFNFNMKPRKNGTLIAFIVTLVLFMIAEYILLTPINLRSPEFLMVFAFFMLLFVLLKCLLCADFGQFGKIGCIIPIVIVVLVFVGDLFSSEIFNAKKYQSQLEMDEDADFYEDNEVVNYESIPVVDKDSAVKLGKTQIGKISEYVSQFDIDEEYTQINYNDNPYRVTTLSYSNIFKWFTNQSEGLPAYISVNMVTQDSEVVVLDEGMKYSKSDHFFRNIERYLRLKYPTLMFEEASFEIDDDGNPYWVAPVYYYTIGLFGGEDIKGAVLVNAVTGESEYYSIDDVPSWIDRVYPSDLIVSQLENWGKYSNGYINTWTSQTGVLKPTDGYNYVALDDDVYLYTGLTSVSEDTSNVGFALINLRTKEAKYYAISGADEYSAMSSAEGKVQNLGYEATFPILINAGGYPTYFMSLKDDEGLVKQYAFVSVENYQIVATGESVVEAEENYYQLLEDNGQQTTSNELVTETINGTITSLSNAVVDGNTYYYFMVEDYDDVFIASITSNDTLPLMEVGDYVEFTYNSDSTTTDNASDLEIEKE